MKLQITGERVYKPSSVLPLLAGEMIITLVRPTLPGLLDRASLMARIYLAFLRAEIAAFHVPLASLRLLVSVALILNHHF